MTQRNARGSLRIGTLSLTLVLRATLAYTWAPDPLVGTWKLERQEMNGETGKVPPLQLSVYQIRDSLSFAFAALIDDAYVTTMGYRVLLDGTEADVKNAKGEKVGTVKVTVSAPSVYAITMSRPDRPSTTGKLTLSADGNTLTSETDTPQGDRSIHLLQMYVRQVK
jgi:hypothetical protein